MLTGTAYRLPLYITEKCSDPQTHVQGTTLLKCNARHAQNP